MSPDLVALLSPKQRRAAELVALDLQTDEAIARELRITKRTLERWKRQPAFRAAVQGAAETLRRAVQERGIAERQNRVDAYNEIWRRLHQVLAERASDPLVAGVPGGRTGLIVPSPMLVKVFDSTALNEDDERELERLTSARESRIVYEYQIDTGLLKELREYAKLAAQDLGQWTERREVAGDKDSPITIRVVYADPDADPAETASSPAAGHS